ncbi:MAG: hypothetical protein GXP55_18150 [Deltaproteobacteria bacterium]|nr:hypothetical protein [Deltaproteobacteria bacterium]
MIRLVVALVAVSCVLPLSLACGARTGLGVDLPDASAADSSVPECTRRADCDDGVACTINRCESNRCVLRLDDSRCALRSVCSVGRCDRRLGCVSDATDCSDGVACTVDSCDELDGCTHEPDASLCPISHRCDVVRGCVAQALIHDSDALYQVDLPSGAYSRVTPLGVRLTDIALTSDRRLLGVNYAWVFEIDETLGVARPLFRSPAQLVALEEGPGGVLYGAGQDRRIVAMDPLTGRPNVVARLPRGWVASGDIAFVDGRMLVTATDVPSSERGSDQLAEIDLETGTARLLGPVGYACIWALAAFGPTLYGFSCHGDLLRIDPFSGASERLRVLPLRIGGAAAR